MAWLVFEVSKNWGEADADISETIDFCEFYSREALRLSKVETPVQLPGERDSLFYIPLGVGAVIPPWNFPCAIMAGMTLASIVCGNTVVLKPSSDSPIIAAKFCRTAGRVRNAGRRGELLPGSGATFGNVMVDHPQTRYIAFTGSREVGLDINKNAAQQAPGQMWIKRTVLEMGGKDATIVDADADMDAAVEGVAAAAFSFQGQKCSACSRAIIDERIYDTFLAKLKARVEKIKMGDPAENANMAAVINEGAMQTILDYIEMGKREGRLVTGGEGATSPGEGYFVQPTVIADIDPEVETRAGRDFRPGTLGDQSPQLRARPRDCQQYRVRLDRRDLYQLAGEDRSRQPRLPRRQPVHQPQMHRRNGGSPSLRRLQHVGHRLEIRRPGLSLPVQPGEIGRREDCLTGGNEAGATQCGLCVPKLAQSQKYFKN